MDGLEQMLQLFQLVRERINSEISRLTLELVRHGGYFGAGGKCAQLLGQAGRLRQKCANNLLYKRFVAGGQLYGVAIAGERTVGGGNGAVPEPATWAMMLVGFGAIGGALRYRRRKTSVSFA